MSARGRAGWVVLGLALCALGAWAALDGGGAGPPGAPAAGPRPFVLPEAAHARRRGRLGQVLAQMRLGLDAAGRERLLEALDGFQRARLEFWARPEVAALAPEAYAEAYRAFVAPHAAAARALVPDPAEAEAVVRRFVDDGRVVRPGEGSAGAPGVW